MRQGSCRCSCFEDYFSVVFSKDICLQDDEKESARAWLYDGRHLSNVGVYLKMNEEPAVAAQISDGCLNE